MEDRMMRTAGSEDFHSSEYKSKVTSIVTKGDTVIPEGVVESWDISEKQNGNVIAYAEDDGTGAGTYKLTIGGEGKIIANYDMSNYFSGFSNTISIDLSYLDTSLTTNMMDMFAGDMFSAEPYMSIEEINFGEYFSTSNVTNMAEMFMYCNKLSTLNLDAFDTTKVILIGRMFFRCEELKKLDLRNFDTSNVTNYNQIFNYTTNITEILVTRDKWTIPSSAITNSGVTDFTYM